MSLTGGGLVAALLVGAAALAEGGRWALLLVLFFIAATAASRYRQDAKARRAGGLLEKSGARDASQVLANGGAFAVGAVGLALTGELTWGVFAVGALAAASADTWATEIGLLSSRSPRSITTGRIVPPGYSGGVTLAGSLAGVVGALVVTLAAVALGTGVAPLAPLAGGVAGMFVDSILGATIQERRWCPGCGRPTERRVHGCGALTIRSGGVSGLRNDAVNALATIAGGGIGVLAWLGLR